MAESLFWLFLCVFLYTYLGYPVLLWLFSFRLKKRSKHRSELPSVAVVIAAYNEQEVIAPKLLNTLQLHYPASKMKVVVVADGSTDRTTAIVKEFNEVQLLFQPERNGKSAAINRAMEIVDAEVVVVTDANTFLSSGTLTELLAPFADERVGGVSGAKKVQAAGTVSAAGSGEGIYWRYESMLKELEASFYSVIGAAGELFAFRRVLFRPIPAEAITDDFYVSLSINLQGKTIAYTTRAAATEAASLSIQDEWNRKVRIAAGGFQSLLYFATALNPFLYPRLSFQFFSHRVLRWFITMPALLFIFFCNAWLVLQRTGVGYDFLFVLQCFFYGLALAGFLFRHSGTNRFLQLPFYFVMMHAALPVGAWRYMTGRQSAVWQKARRPVSE